MGGDVEMVRGGGDGDIVDEIDEMENEDPRRILPWTKQVTVRGLVASLIIGIMYSIIVMKLNLTTGLVPTLNVSAALLAFVFLRTWTKILHKAGVVSTPFTRQENTVVQTCAVACYSIAVGGGFGSYLLGLNKRTYELAGIGTEGNTPGSYKELGIAWMTAFLFIVSFVGLLVLVPLRKIMIIDYKLTYPSGTATAVLINGFHTKKGDQNARKQVQGFSKFFTMSFLWSFFQWFFSGGESCGFSQFPTFGLQAWKQTFFFDFSMTYVGAGMICSHLVNLSLLLGAILSWGIMWPLISKLKGDWYPADIAQGSMKSLQGYKVFLSISLILGDGFYNFIKISFFTAKSIISQSKQRNTRSVLPLDHKDENLDEALRNEVFMKDSIPIWLAYTGYAGFSVISVIAIPLMFPEVKWYYVIIAYLLAPALGFCNAYGAGLTDMNMAYNYGKVSLFIIASWAGGNSGVVAGLVACGLIKSVVSISADLMHDFKTGHLTLTSPRSMLLSQAVGTAIGCIVSPLTFFLFYKAFDVGNPDGNFKAPYALIYRNMAILGVEGFSALPHHCLQLCYGFFGFAVFANIIRDISPAKYSKWVPLPMVMAVPFLVGASFAIDMCIGSLVVFTWNYVNKEKASLMIPAVASGLICGDGLWTLPSSLLALAKIDPPILVFSICFYFLLQIRATTTNCSSGVMETTQTTHIFILSGQSNMAGRGEVYNGEWNKLVPPECQPNPRILRFSAESEWVEANVPLHADIDVTKVCGIGPGMIFANNYLPVCAAKTVVGLVPCAIGGTAIAEWEKGEKLYNDMLARAVSALEKAGSGGAIKGVLWYQGESDTDTKSHADVYKAKMKKLISDVRSDLCQPALPFIQVALASGLEEDLIDLVREAQLSINLPNVLCVDAKSLPLKPDNLHLTTDAQVMLGEMLAGAYVTHFNDFI